MKKTLAKTVMLAMLLTFAFFNIKYIFEIGGDIRCYGVTMLLRNIVNKQEAMLNLIMFIVFMSILIITYLIIVSKEKKDSNKKEMKNVFLLIVQMYTIIQRLEDLIHNMVLICMRKISMKQAKVILKII